MAGKKKAGWLLNDILNQALQLDWSRQALRRSPAPLPPPAQRIKGGWPLDRR